MSPGRSVVAIVDDDPRLRESVEELFESAGYTARSYPSARMLLDAGLNGLDALITDIGLPDVDGFELRDRVLEARPGLPVFLITGRHELADQTRPRGAAGFFRKPFDADELLSAVQHALGPRRAGGDDET
jgi:FixJ family two-component response regulator